MGKRIIKFRFFKHTADVKFRAYGKNINSAFENSAMAMTSIMYKGKVKKSVKKTIIIKGKDYENLLYGLLEKMLILLDSENFLLSDIKVKIDKNKLSAEIYGDDSEKYNLGIGIKAVTYNQMKVFKLNNKWICQVVLDV